MARFNSASVRSPRLLGIVEAFVDRAKADAAKVRMEEVRRHLDDTYVTWAGGTADDSAFYVRVTQGGTPTQKHVHSSIRTPNGNDYVVVPTTGAALGHPVTAEGRTRRSPARTMR